MARSPPAPPCAERPLVVCLMGPTAAGKTGLAVALARRLPLALISVDSALVYRGLDIGTAKPGPELLAEVPHRLIDICDPAETYSAARFRSDALGALAEIHSGGAIPLLVGGTMLYFRALLRGLSPLPDANPELRARLEAEAARSSWAALHQRLAAVDPLAAARIHPHDPQRIQRALEVYELTGQPISSLQGQPPSEAAFPYRPLKLVVAPRERGELHRRIEQRFEAMLAAGFEVEVRRLWARGDLSPELPALRAVGYRQMLKYVIGEYTYAAMRERGVAATRQLAKRQLTWLRNEEGCHWLNDGRQAVEEARRLIAAALGRI